MKMDRKIFISGKIKTLTGLHIGGSSIGLEIGGADSIVVRNPFNNQPYIPGSSLKGKKRALIEKLYGRMEKDGNPCQDPEFRGTKLFGTSADREHEGLSSRIIVRDGLLLNEEELKDLQNTDMPYTEIKTEVCIDRNTSKANPRQIERVHAGAEFELNMILCF